MQVHHSAVGMMLYFYFIFYLYGDSGGAQKLCVCYIQLTLKEDVRAVRQSSEQHSSGQTCTDSSSFSRVMTVCTTELYHLVFHRDQVKVHSNIL